MLLTSRLLPVTDVVFRTVFLQKIKIPPGPQRASEIDPPQRFVLRLIRVLCFWNRSRYVLARVLFIQLRFIRSVRRVLRRAMELSSYSWSETFCRCVATKKPCSKSSTALDVYSHDSAGEFN